MKAPQSMQKIYLKVFLSLLNSCPCSSFGAFLSTWRASQLRTSKKKKIFKSLQEYFCPAWLCRWLEQTSTSFVVCTYFSNFIIHLHTSLLICILIFFYLLHMNWPLRRRPHCWIDPGFFDISINLVWANFQNFFAFLAMPAFIKKTKKKLYVAHITKITHIHLNVKQ
jgi:hypothetical protein